MSVRMPGVATTGSAPQAATFAASQLAISVRDGCREHCHLLRPDMSLGRAAENAICVDHCDVRAMHATVARNELGEFVVRTTDERFHLTLPNGDDASEIRLAPGVSFRIGGAVFRCREVLMLDAHDARIPFAMATEAPAENSENGDSDNSDNELSVSDAFEAVAASPPLRVSCPRCRQFLAHLAVGARFCPRCGLELPEHCPPWLEGTGEDDDGYQALLRPITLRAYVTAMLNLGIRHEVGRAGERNLEVAVRYYSTAAKLGSAAARARLGAAATRVPADSKDLTSLTA